MERHRTDKYKKGKKINNKLIFFILIISIIGIGIVFYQKSKIDNNPTDEVNNAFKYLKEGNIKSANSYVDYEQLINGLDEMILQEESEDSAEVEKLLFDNLSWNIKDVDLQEDEATVTIEVTNKDYKDVITKWMKSLVSKKAEGEALDNELAIAELKNVLSQENETRTTTEKISLRREEKDWRIEMNENFVNLVYPGIDIIQQVLNNEIS